MCDDNIIWKSLYWQDDDLVALARHALELNAFQEVAQAHGLVWDESFDTDTRDFGLRVPTAQLARVIGALRVQGIPFGMVDCRTEEALALCQRLGVDAEWIESL